MSDKICSHCKQTLPEESYYRHRKNGKLWSACKVCQRAWCARWANENREKVRASAAAARASDPEKERERHRRNRLADPEKCRAKVRRSHAKHRDQRRAESARYRQEHLEELRARDREYQRRFREERPFEYKEKMARDKARKLEVLYEKLDYEAIYREANGVCHICGQPILAVADLVFDHVISMCNGGGHVRDNVRPAHYVCNRSKNRQ